MGRELDKSIEGLKVVLDTAIQCQSEDGFSTITLCQVDIDDMRDIINQLGTKGDKNGKVGSDLYVL